MKPFINWTYSPEVLQERAMIVQRLAAFALQGTESKYTPGELHKSHATLMNAVQARLAEAFVQPVLSKTGKRLKSAPAGDTAELVIETFKNRWNQLPLTVTPSLEGTVVDGAFQSAFNTTSAPFGRAEPSVAGAYQRAKDNYFLTCSRIHSLHALQRLLRRSEYGNDETMPGFSNINYSQYENTRRYLELMMLFGGLLGGEAAKEAVRMMAEQSCHSVEGTRYSLMHFLTIDGYSPGSYYSADDEAFRKDIAEKYNNL